VDAKIALEFAGLTLVAITVIAVVINRVKTAKGIGIRAIQFVAIPAVLVFLLILGLEHLLEAGAVTAVLGAIVGYVFAKQGPDE
jgi:hypothetical protein